MKGGGYCRLVAVSFVIYLLNLVELKDCYALDMQMETVEQ